MTHFIRNIDLFSIPSSTRASLEALNFPKMHDVFNPNTENSDKALIFAAFANEIPIGQISAYLYPDLKQGFIGSFSVIHSLQNQDIGVELMNSLIEAMLARGIEMVTIQYQFDDYLETVLIQTGWSPPKLLMRRYFLEKSSFSPPWYFSSSPKLPSNISLFPWVEADLKDLEIAKVQLKINPLIAQYSPFDSLYPIDSVSSLGMRKNGILCGWIINHRVTPNLLRYSAFYLSQELRGSGSGIGMLKESIKRHLSAEPDLQACMEINFNLSSLSWIRFIEKRLAPYASKVEDTHYSFYHVS